MAASFESRVARGAAWLDVHERGWERRVDLATLSLTSDCRCVLGQVRGDYHVSVEGERPEFYWALAHGFMGGVDDDNRTCWVLLDEAWISLIKERFASGLLSDEAEA
jgi:hypothetical protein